MSVPRELLDQLLTGYLDDALSADERARVEQLLQSDPEVVKELDQLRTLRQSLKAVAKADSAIKLDKGFSDRVIGAAMARAHAEGLSEDHPLVRLAEQPSTSRPGAKGAPWRTVGLMVAIAASVMFAMFMLRPDVNEEPLLVQADPDAVAEPDPVATPEVVVEDPAVPSVEMIASSDPDSVTQPDPVSPPEATSPETTTPEVAAPGPMIASTDNPGVQEQTAPPAAMVNQIEQLQVLERMSRRKNFVMVLDVQLTGEGREGNALEEAMKLAELGAMSRKPVSEEFASMAQGVAGSLPEGEGEEVSLLLLQSTAQKLDRFYIHLQNDLSGVATVRLALPNMRVLDAVDEVTVGAELVQHTEATLELFSEGEAMNQFASYLQQLQYEPMNRANPDQMPKWGPETEDGPVVPAQWLVLVR